ncbi:hypothetical protein B7494_g5985 [Chlorociboria aeruginascens]|nr:hypothetical protein B7494_g5985 [Chlorociboria aeruginascens]
MNTWLTDVTFYDNVRAQHTLITKHFDIQHARAVIGWSMGAGQAFQWATMYPDFIDICVPFCGAAKTSIHNQVFLEGAKAALLATKKQPSAGPSKDGVLPKGEEYRTWTAEERENGLKAFGRVYAGWGFSQTFYRQKVYETHLGFKGLEDFLTNFWEAWFLSKDPENLLVMLRTWQAGDCSDQEPYNGDFKAAMRGIKAKTLVLPSKTDLYFPPEDSEIEVANMKLGVGELGIFPSGDLQNHDLNLLGIDNHFGFFDVQFQRMIEPEANVTWIKDALNFQPCCLHSKARLQQPLIIPEKQLLKVKTTLVDTVMADSSVKPIELSFPLPKAPDTSIHLHLTINKTSLLLFLTTAINGDTSTTAPLGSFVYALPDRINSSQALSTPLYTFESSVEFTTRLAKLLARKSGKPVYVGNSISFASAGMGGTVEEEMEGFKKVVEVVMDEVQRSDDFEAQALPIPWAFCVPAYRRLCELYRKTAQGFHIQVMVMAWQPQEEPLRQLSRCLRDSLSGHNKTAQKQAELMLADAKSSPDINNYLTYLFSSSQAPGGLPYSFEEYFAIRSAAAIMLKNNIKTGYKGIPMESLGLIRSSIPNSLQDQNPLIRSYAGNVITEIVSRGGILGWPQLLPELMTLIANENGSVTPEAQEGAMAALAKICEDNKKVLDKEYAGERPLTFIIPKLIDFAGNPKPKIRSLALGCLNVFIPHPPQALIANLDHLLNRLFQLASDPSDDVRRQVCRAFVQIVEVRPDKILPHIAGLVDYMLAQQQKTDDEDLACDAAEFWLTVGEHNELWQSLGPYLNKIIPVLLESMVYSEEDVALLEGGGDDADIEDRAEDIKPTFAKNKSARTLANSEEGGESNQNGGNYAKISGMDDDLEEGEVSDYEDGDDDGNPEDRWNLRKCSAAALDVFATDFGGPVFETILPYLMKNLKHEDWSYREAAVLALGAVAEGCMDVVTPHLPDLVPYLISLLKDTEPLVRQITCWTLGRYSAWGAGLVEPTLRSQYFEPMMEGILTKMLDPNKRVQEAGASAFAHLEEKAGPALTPYCEPIIRQFVRCFEKYKDRNMFILYDCVQTLAEHVGAGLASPNLIDLLMPALIHRWHKVFDQSRELFPLLECLSYVATALGESFIPFAPPVFTRCIKIIHQNLEESLAAVNNPILDAPDKDFLVTSLDLISAIVQAVEDEQAAALVSASQPQLFDLLSFCMEDAANDVRQSSYALLGDCAKVVFPQLRPFLPVLLPKLIHQLDLDSILDSQKESGFSVINNACWSSGEISIQYGKEMAPYVGKLLERLLSILGNPEVPKSVLENAAIALGRLGLNNADVLAPHLSTFSEPFLKSIKGVDFTLEKATAFKGFLLVVVSNPQAMEKDIARLFTSIARYKKDLAYETPLTADLHQMFQHTIDLYKTLIPNFSTFLSQQIPANDVTSLTATYNL